MRVAIVLLLLALSACRIERVSGQHEPSAQAETATELWVYTSMYRHVIDALTPHLERSLPGVKINWFQAGSEKVAAKLEGELAGGGSPCDVLLTSDPFIYERFKDEGRWLRYVSPNGLRTPAPYVDLDGHFAAIRLSTMVLVKRAGADAPTSFAGLMDARWKGQLVIGDPLTSGTAFTWATTVERSVGPELFTQLRAAGVRVGGGNAAVLQKIQGGEAIAGVLLLENALDAKRKGSPIEIVWPDDGAVVVPGYAGIFASSAHPETAKRFIDALHSLELQQVIAAAGDMHAVDPRVPGPGGARALDELIRTSRPIDEALLDYGLEHGAEVKARFSRAFVE